MKNDSKILEVLVGIKLDVDFILAQPNLDALTDRYVESVIEKAKELSTLYEDNFSSKPEEVSVDISRYILEPRMNAYSGYKWLVIFDNLTCDYLRESNNPRAYVKFRNSREAFDYLKEEVIGHDE